MLCALCALPAGYTMCTYGPHEEHTASPFIPDDECARWCAVVYTSVYRSVLCALCVCDNLPKHENDNQNTLCASERYGRLVRAHQLQHIHRAALWRASVCIADVCYVVELWILGHNTQTQTTRENQSSIQTPYTHSILFYRQFMAYIEWLWMAFRFDCRRRIPWNSGFDRDNTHEK